jgi:hypothetical protein
MARVMCCFPYPDPLQSDVEFVLIWSQNNTEGHMNCFQVGLQHIHSLSVLWLPDGEVAAKAPHPSCWLQPCRWSSGTAATPPFSGSKYPEVPKSTSSTQHRPSPLVSTPACAKRQQLRQVGDAVYRLPSTVYRLTLGSWPCLGAHSHTICVHALQTP